MCSDVIQANEKLEFGICRTRMGHLSEASAIASAGGSIVHATVNSQSPTEAATEDFLPLTVDYRSRTYAFGKVPLEKTRKEKNGSDQDILVSRFIDRAVRPLFPKGYVNEVQLIVTNHSADGVHDPTVLGVNAASLAMLTSKQPWNGPIGCVRVGLVNDQLIVNPPVTDMVTSKLDLLYAGTENRAVM
jgi:polyribonucleotide nucleotidyltransferase